MNHTEIQRMAQIMGVDAAALAASVPAQRLRTEALALGFNGTHYDPQRRAAAVAGMSTDVQRFAAEMGVDAHELQARIPAHHQVGTQEADAARVAFLMGVDPAALAPKASGPLAQKVQALAAQIEQLAQDMAIRQAGTPAGATAADDAHQRTEILRLMGCNPDQIKGT